MAIYPYRCKECGRQEEVVQSIASYCESPNVPSCHGPMERFITAPMFSIDIAPWAAYRSPIDGTVITSRAERNEHMARHGVVLYDDIAPDIERNRKDIAKKAVADIKQDVIEATHKVLDHGYKPNVIPESELIPNV
jgi:putative FmdB family regulatory protein